jgi:L-alanine-DL-glutamate epimerase-like enolase superfamily enzyme
MRIIGIDVYEHMLTYAHGSYAMSGGRVASAQPSTLVRIRTDQGIDGWGESCALGATYLPSFSAGGVRAALADLAPALVGLDPTNLGAINARISSLLRGYPGARSAVDVACWDITGKALGVPVSTLLGGVLQQDFPLYEAVPLASPQEMAAFVVARREAGISCFQVKVGNRPADDVARVRATVAVGGGSRMICDANGGWRLQDAIVAVRQLADLHVYIEQPCETLEDIGRVRAVTTLPLVADESVLDLPTLVAAKEVAQAGSVNLKIGRLGGLTAARRMRDAAVALGMTVTLEDTWGGDVATAAVAHLAATTAPDDMLSASFFNDWTQEHVAPVVRPVSVNGRGSAPTRPGLGVEVDVTLLGAPLFSVG